MTHPKTGVKPRYTALLTQADSNVFHSRSNRGILALSEICEILYTKLKSGKIKVSIFVKDDVVQKQVADKLHANDFKCFKFHRPNKPVKSK